MVVVDPATRKLLIPCNCIYPTRAQQRAAIPSLCQLFLQGRCRQGAQCHQVHANVDVVMVLRGQVGNLPRCCLFHGDDDIAGVLNERSLLSKVVLYIPEVSFEGGYVPLNRFSYTPALRRVLKEKQGRLMPDNGDKEICGGSDLQAEGSCLVLNAGDQSICRLHIFDRCRYADDCRFLHVCKEVTSSFCTSQGAGDAKPDSRGQQNKSVFTSVSRQQQLRGYPLRYSVNELVSSNAFLQIPLFASKSTWEASASSPWSMYSSPTLSGATAARGTQTLMMVHYRRPSSPTSVTPNGSFCAPTLEGSMQGSSFQENAFMVASYSLESQSVVAATPPSGNAQTASWSTKNLPVLFESDVEMDADRPPWDEDLSPSSPDGVLDLPAVTGGAGLKRHWQHNPYRVTLLSA
ncbi:hypothetical protein TRSC58_00606 [Trypanosoma rangeli SC58]|uniref:C3H1-type domain-containing protein n=1 Tax=Trypanosoma rangeli SC58 TaxID=429131 RepID=A0A061J9T0_TRYRA|nr:hypothetical protein TRSC58_00606 [Trypanosoma rangeli SC58]